MCPQVAYCFINISNIMLLALCDILVRTLYANMKHVPVHHPRYDTGTECVISNQCRTSAESGPMSMHPNTVCAMLEPCWHSTYLGTLVSSCPTTVGKSKIPSLHTNPVVPSLSSAFCLLLLLQTLHVGRYALLSGTIPTQPSNCHEPLIV